MCRLILCVPRGLRKSKPNKSYSNIVRYNPASSTYRFQCGFISSMSLRSLITEALKLLITREIHVHAIDEEQRRAIESVERLVLGPKFGF